MAVERTAEAPIAADPQPAPRSGREAASGARKWLAIGTGAAIEIAGSDLRLAAVRVRPSGVEVTGSAVIANFRERPATEWGAEYAAFARSAGVGRVPVTVLLPRADVIVRHLSLPGVAQADLASAVALQLDTLHPFAEDSAAFGWAPLDTRPGQPPAVLVGIAQRETVDQYANLFAEAGLRMARFTFSAAALYSASRILVKPPAGFVAVHEEAGALEFHGESPSRPVFSSQWEGSAERGLALAFSQLRLPADAPALSIEDVLPPLSGGEAPPMAVAAAIVSACPRLSADANLLPEDRRTQSSRLVYLPTAVLGGALALAAIALFLEPGFHERHYLRQLEQEIRTLETQAAEAARLDQRVQSAKDRIALLDRYRRRAKADADALREATNLLPAPGWIQSFQLTRTDVSLQGEAEQATALLKLIDESPLFKDSSFAQAMTRTGTGEQFVIRAQREGEGSGLEKGESR
ncbi:MAG: PilN domain-containing protein [Bryobacteraceae bacterium]